MRAYEEGEAHPVAVGVSVCDPGRLFWPAHGSNAPDDGLLRLDALQQCKAVTKLLHT